MNILIFGGLNIKIHIMRIAESELIINDDGSAFHIHLKPEELADIVILVGDPGRVDMVAGFLTDIEFRHKGVRLHDRQV